MFHDLLSRDREDGRATGQPQGVESEAYLNGTSQGSTPEDARKDGDIRGRSKSFIKHPGQFPASNQTFGNEQDSIPIIMEHDLHALSLSRRKTLVRSGMIGSAAFLN